MKTYEILDATGEVVNTILADEAFVEAQFPGRWRLLENAQSNTPEIVVTGIVADAEHAGTTTVSGTAEVTCEAGATLTINAELRDASGNVLPLTDNFRMPFRSRDGREKVLLAVMADGIVTINAQIKDSGVWITDEAAINEALPDANRMKFSGITVYVVEV